MPKGFKHSEETKKKLSKMALGRKHTEETKQKMSESTKGKNHPLYGTHRSEETKQKISQSLCGEKSIWFGIKGMEHPRYGTKTTEEQRQRMSEGQAKTIAAMSVEERRQRFGTFKNRKHTEETKKKIKDSNAAFWKVHKRPLVTDEQKEKISLGVAKAMIEGRMNFANRSKEYARGHFESIKAGRVYYRSALELLFYREMDKSVLVESFEVEPLWLAYTNPEDNKTHRYVPDMLVTFVDGTKKLVELKPTYMLSDLVNQAKFRASRIYAKKQGWTFDVWTEKAVA